MQTEHLTHIEEKVHNLLKESSNPNVEGGIAKAFGDADDEMLAGLKNKVATHASKHDAIATICGHNTATVKESLKEYPATEVQNALSNLKKMNLILQLGRGRGRAFVVFAPKDTSTTEEATPEPEMAAQREEENTAPEPTKAENVEPPIRAAATEENKKTEDKGEDIKDDVDILEEALDTIYKLFQRKRIEEQDTLKDMRNLDQEIERLKKQVERLEEQTTDIELTTWR